MSLSHTNTVIVMVVFLLEADEKSRLIYFQSDMMYKIDIFV